MKKVIAWLLALTMIFSMPLSVAAEELASSNMPSYTSEQNDTEEMNDTGNPDDGADSDEGDSADGKGAGDTDGDDGTDDTGSADNSDTPDGSSGADDSDTADDSSDADASDTPDDSGNTEDTANTDSADDTAQLPAGTEGDEVPKSAAEDAAGDVENADDSGIMLTSEEDESESEGTSYVTGSIPDASDTANLGYTACLGFGGNNWAVGSWWEVATSVNGAGSYTLNYDTATEITSVDFLCFEIRGDGAYDTITTDYTLTNVKVIADGKTVYSAATATGTTGETATNFRLVLTDKVSSFKSSLTIQFSLVKNSSGDEEKTTDISEANVTVTPESTEYTGSAIEPEVTVKVGETALTESTDYTVSYTDAEGNAVEAPVEVGTYTVTVSGTGSYTGSATATFTITEVDDGGDTDDYKYMICVGYGNRWWSPTDAVGYTGAGSCTLTPGASLSTTFYIEFRDPETGAESASPDGLKYLASSTSYGYISGNYEIKNFQVLSGATEVESTVTAGYGENAGYRLTVKLSQTVSNPVVKFDLVRKSSEVAISENAVSVTVEEGTVSVGVVVDGSTLVENTDYTLVYKDSNGTELSEAPTEAGTYSVIITGMGSYTGTVTKEFTIAEESTDEISYNAVLQINQADTATQTITGEGIYTFTAAASGVWNIYLKIEEAYTALSSLPASLKVTVGDTVLFNGAVTLGQIWSNATGEWKPTEGAEVKIFANWEDQLLTKDTTIPSGDLTVILTLGETTDDGNTATEISEDAVSVTVEEGVVSVSVVLDGSTLTENTDYTVTYLDSDGTELEEAPTEAGTYSAVITGKDNYTGTVTKSFTIEETSETEKTQYQFCVGTNKTWWDAKYAVNFYGAGHYELNVTENISNFTMLFVELRTSVESGSLSNATNTWKLYGDLYDVKNLSVYGDNDELLFYADEMTAKEKESSFGIIIHGDGVSNITNTAAATAGVKITFDLVEASTVVTLADENVTLEYETVAYDGSAKAPAVTVTVSGTELVLNTDYTVDYTNNTEAGTATVTVTGIGSYTGTVEKTFEITENDDESTGYTAYLGYGVPSWWPSTGGDVKTTVTGAGTYTLEWTIPASGSGTQVFYIHVVDAYEALKDLTVSDMQIWLAGESIDVNLNKLSCGEYTNDDGETGYEITIYNAYGGTNWAVSAFGELKQGDKLRVQFTLGDGSGSGSGGGDTATLTEGNVSLEYDTVKYDGSEKKPAVTVTVDGTVLSENTDYTVAYADNTEVGTATVTITGKGSYTGTVEKTFTITEEDFSYNVYLGYSDASWWPGTYGDMSENKSNVSGFCTTISGDGPYNITLEWKDISGLNWDNAAEGTNIFMIHFIDLYEKLQNYKATSMQVWVDGTELSVDLDALVYEKYTRDNGESGFAITLYPNAVGSITKISNSLKVSFTLEDPYTSTDLNASNVALEYDKVKYDGSSKTPGVLFGDTTLVLGTDYTVAYTDADGKTVAAPQAIGTYTVSITGTGDYTGTVEKTLTITDPNAVEMELLVNNAVVDTEAINGKGTYTLTASPSGIWHCAVRMPDAYETLKDYSAVLKVVSAGTTIYEDDVTLAAQWVDDGTGTYVESDNCYIEIYASWNSGSLVTSVPDGELTVTLTLTDKKEEDTGGIQSNGNAYLCYSDADWYPGVSLESTSPVTTTVNGGGTYTLSWDLEEWETAEGIMVFYIDIIGEGKALNGYGVTDMKITIDGKNVPVDVSKLNVGDLENNGNFRIEIYNNWGSTKNDCPIDVSVLNSVSENVTVQFTLEAGKASVNNNGASEVPGQAVYGMWNWGSAYTVKMQYSDADWYPGAEIYGKVDANGTYNFWWNLADWEDVSGVKVFYIDILGAAEEVHLTSLKIYADGREIAVDMDKVLTGDLEGKGNYRIEIYNDYGATASDAPISKWLSFYNNLLVTFTLEEGPDPVEEEEFTGEGFKATMVFNDADWWPQTSITTGVTGPGIYTLSWDLAEGEMAEGIVTFYIDIFDAYYALRDLELTDLVIMVDGEPIDIDLSKVLVGDLEGYGNYRIEIYNEYGATKLDPPVNTDLVICENLTVTFTLAEPVPEETTEPAPETEATAPSAAEETEESGSKGLPAVAIGLSLLAVIVIVVILLRKKASIG